MKLYVFDSGRVDTATQVVRIKPMPHPTLIDSLPCGLYVPDVYSSYQWYFVNLTTFTTGDTINYTPSTYSSLAFVFVDSNGCYGRSDTDILCPERVNNFSKSNFDITIFPNPGTHVLTIACNQAITVILISNLSWADHVYQ